MRITNTQITSVMSGSMNANSAELADLMQRMASGKRMLRPSDDPVASMRLQRTQREEANLALLNKSIANVSSGLSIQETNLRAMSDAVLNVRDLLLWAGNGPAAPEDLAAIGGELESLEDTILSYGNARDGEGRYMLAGTLIDKPAVSYDSAMGSYSLNGNAKHRQVAVATGVLMDENITAEEVFGSGVDLLNNLHQLVKVLKDPSLNSSDPAVSAKITDTLAKLDTTHSNVVGAVSELGARQNMLTLFSSSNEDISVVNQQIEGELSSLDYAGASIDLANYQLSLQATQKTYLKINQLSLFGML